MSYTNHTSNYNLPQYVGTDKPTYLGDFNTAMGIIDLQMKSNADNASTASSGVNTLTTSVGTLANLTTTDKTDLVSAINEVDTNADTAQNTANTASGTASSALTASTNNATAIQAISNYLNINNFTTYNISNLTIVSGGGTINTSWQPSITVARNADGSLCKIYGQVNVTSTANTTSRIKLNVDTGLHPDTQLVITNTGVIWGTSTFANINMYINPDGTIEFEGYHASETFDFRMFACVIFVKNFGDQPEA